MTEAGRDETERAAPKHAADRLGSKHEPKAGVSVQISGN